MIRVIRVNAFNCRSWFWIVDVFTRYAVQPAINCVYGYKCIFHEKWLAGLIKLFGHFLCHFSATGEKYRIIIENSAYRVKRESKIQEYKK